MDLQEKHYLCESNQAFWNIYDEVRVYQCLVHGRGNSTKRLWKGGTRPWAKAIERKHPTFSFRLRL